MNNIYKKAKMVPCTILVLENKRWLLVSDAFNENLAWVVES